MEASLQHSECLNSEPQIKLVGFFTYEPTLLRNQVARLNVKEILRISHSSVRIFLQVRNCIFKFVIPLVDFFVFLLQSLVLFCQPDKSNSMPSNKTPSSTLRNVNFVTQSEFMTLAFIKVGTLNPKSIPVLVSRT